jgi:high-affinity Fe2+/Pb2+ permease
MSLRIILIVALLVGVVVGIVAKALGLQVFVQVATGIAYALTVGGPSLWWWNKNKSSHGTSSPNRPLHTES